MTTSTTDPARELLLQVAVNSPLNRCFDYLPPESMSAGRVRQLVPGLRVRVPFGNREMVGIITGTTSDSDVPSDKLKAAIEVLDEQPVFDTATLELYHWASRYYHFPLGQALQTSLPTRVRQGKPLTVKGMTEDSPGLARHRDLYGETRPLELNPEQRQALKAVLGQRNYHCFLLEGVTGSGKTEVYLQLISSVLEAGRQILVLVPEISLTPQTLNRFTRRFNRTVIAIHSGLTDAERFRAWLQARNGTADIIIGTRSAVFTPLARPGLIIVDEEHDPSYKQQEGFRYSARDLAIYRARALDIPVVLGSATPSLESLHNALSGRYSLLPLRERAAVASMPTFRFLDMRGQALNEGFSLPLLEAIGAHLAQGNQVLVFINRRGFAPLLQCHDCGWTATCPRCETGFTLHQKAPELRCHHCDSQRRLVETCPSCQGKSLLAIGTGTERSEKVLAETFPNVPLLRVDRDTTRNKKELENMIASVKTGRSCILVGTQMLAKGHHFPGVTLAAVLDADSGLFSADFRGQEQMGQLITQVAGRAGRGSEKGEVLIQTHHSTHPGLNALIRDGYGAFARGLLREREAAELPPFTHHILLRADHSGRQGPERFLEAVRREAQAMNHADVYLLGPLPAPMEKRAGRFRYQLLLQSRSRAALHELTGRLRKRFETWPESRRIRWSIDVDPLDFT